jgi:hypothetical protein
VRLKKESVIFVSLIFALLCAFLVIQATRVVASPARTVGVHVGDWEETTNSAQGNLTGFNATNVPVHGKLTVVGISGTNVTCQILSTYKNGTQKTTTGHIDVGTGLGNATGILIAANLNAGDLVYTGQWTFAGTTINETITRNYLGSNVEVNHLSLITNETGSGYSVFSHMDWYWIRGSGLLAEMTENVTEIVSGVKTWEYTHGIVSGAIPEFPVSTILTSFVVLSILAVVCARKRLFKNSKQANTIHLPSSTVPS